MIPRYVSPASVRTIPLQCVDLSAEPLIPYTGWNVQTHEPHVSTVADPSRIRLYQDPAQHGWGAIDGFELLKVVQAHAPCNALLLDHVLANQHLIPSTWECDAASRPIKVCFWGTTYTDSQGFTFVRFLYKSGQRFESSYCALHRLFSSKHYAALMPQ